jgi:hypothetical protein
LRFTRRTNKSSGLRRYSIAHFLVALVSMLLVTPFVEQLPDGNLIEALLLTVVLLSAVPAVGGRRRSLAVGALLVAPALAGTWIHHLHPANSPAYFGLAASIVFAAFVIYHLLAFILRAAHVNSEVLCAAIAAYLMFGVTWAMAYELVWRLWPESFIVTDVGDVARQISGFEALYFSFGTLAPINDSDIVAVSNLARLLVMVEATVGILYMGMLIARLVGIYSNEEAADIAADVAADIDIEIDERSIVTKDSHP